MTALGELLSPRDRERLAARMRELQDLARLAAERGQQQPPPPPVPLHQAANPKERPV